MADFISNNTEDGIPADKQWEFLRILECPVCQEISPPPIFMCINGHIICNDCHDRLMKCPLCAGKLLHTRNLAVEHITSLLQLKCTNEGCGRFFRGDDLKYHIAELCEFRPVSCYCETETKCQGKQIDAIKYENHLKEVHKSEGFDTVQPVYEFFHSAISLGARISNHQRIQYMKVDGKLFLLNDCIANRTFYSWITVADSKEVAKQYEVALTYYNYSTKKARCAWKVGVHSYRTKLEDVQETGELIALPTSILVQMSSTSDLIRGTRKRKRKNYTWRVTARVSNIKTSEDPDT